MVLAFFIAMSYSIYFDMQIIPSFAVEIPCIKTVLPLFNQRVLLGLFPFKQPCFADRLQAEHAILESSACTATTYTKCTDPADKSSCVLLPLGDVLQQLETWSFQLIHSQIPTKILKKINQIK